MSVSRLRTYTVGVREFARRAPLVHPFGVRKKPWSGLCLAMVFFLGSACAPDPRELSPVEAVTAFLSALQLATAQPEQRKTAYEWLDRQSREQLDKRAELARSLSGRPMEPWEMLVPGKLSLPVGAAQRNMTFKSKGDASTVRIAPDGQPVVEIPLVREEGRWRIKLL